MTVLHGQIGVNSAQPARLSPAASSATPAPPQWPPVTTGQLARSGSQPGLLFPARRAALTPPPPIPDPDVPPTFSDRFATYKVEVAWSSFLKGIFVIDTSIVGGPDTLGGTTYNSPFGGPYDDITRRTDNGVHVESVQWTKGRSDDFAQMQALAGTITARDPKGMMDVKNPLSPLNLDIDVNGSIRPLRPVRVTAYFNGKWWPVLYAFLRSVDYEPNGRTGTARLEITGLEVFLSTPRKDQPKTAPQPIIPYTTVGANGLPITTGSAIGLILDWLGWTDASLRDLDIGDGIPFFEATGDRDALQLIAELLAPNLGVFYITAAGVATYEHRTAPFARVVESVVTNDMHALASGVSIDKIRNHWTVTRQTRTGPGVYVDATPQVAEDFPSQNDYGDRGDSITSRFLQSDAQALGIAQELVGVTKDPVGSMWQLAIDNRTGALMNSMLTLDLHSKVQASSLETGMSGTFFVEQISGSIEAQGHKHRVSYMLADRAGSSLAGVSAFIIGTSTVGGPDTLVF